MSLLPALLPQVTWCKAMTGVAKFLSAAGEDAIRVVKHLESTEKTVSPYAFKVLEGMVINEDFLTLANRGLMAEKLSMGVFQNIARKLIRKRWWVWVLTHPELGDRVHSTRGMFAHSRPLSCPEAKCFVNDVCVLWRHLGGGVPT